MKAKIELISTLIKRKETELDDIQWENPDDPRIEDLVKELNYYKNKYEKGELFEPNF